MEYDIASKVILSRCKDSLLRHLCGIAVSSSELIETAPQETASLRRSDFVLRTRLEDGSDILVLIEFQTRWRKWLPIRTLECRCRHLLEEKLPVTTVILLFRPSNNVSDHYHDDEVDYHYRLVKLYEMSADAVLQSGRKCLYPFIPLMKGGAGVLDIAEQEIYKSEKSLEHKADLLTGMAILGGIISKEIPLKLLNRRRDIMIESAAYDLIKNEGLNEGIQIGMEKGIERGKYEGIQIGIDKGLQQGIITAKQDDILEILEGRYHTVPVSILDRIREIKREDALKQLFRTALKSDSFDEFRKQMELILS